MFFPATIRVRRIRRSCCGLLQAQGCEVHRATAPFTVTMKAKKKPQTPDASRFPFTVACDRRRRQQVRRQRRRLKTRQFPAGSYIVRMDQPYSRIADALLDYQYWAPNDPQQDVYDDTGWTMGELGNVQVVRVTDVKALTAPMENVSGDVKAPGAVNGTGSVYLINHNADNNLVTLRYRLKDVAMEAAEEPFEAAGRKFNRGSLIIRKAPLADLQQAAANLGVQVYAVAEAPTVKTHAIGAPRIALMHTWMETQDEGWWRLALDQLRVPLRLHQHAGCREGCRSCEVSMT